MRDLEKMLQEKKEDYDDIDVPIEMEERLRGALKNHKPRPRFLWNIRWIAAVLAILVFTGYHFDTFAYYSKRIIGYDGVMSDSLRDLNQLGKGQKIGKSYTFENGVEVILDGIMVDDNQMLAFYRIKDPNNIMEDHPSYHVEFKGFLKNYRMKSSKGEYLDDEGGEVVYVATFDSPRIWERRLTFNLFSWDNAFQEEASISFLLNRNKAMGSSIKQRLNHEIKVEDIKVHFNRIVATPTQTVIEGNFNNVLELAKESITGDRIRINQIDIKLIADSEEIWPQGSSISTGLRGYHFKFAFEPLPEDIESLKIQLEGLSVIRRPNMKIDLSDKASPFSIEYDYREIKIENVEVVNGNTHITVETEDNISLLDVYLSDGDENLRFIETSPIDHDKKLDGRITYSRVMIFEGHSNDLQLSIGKIIYTAQQQDIIIPIEIK